MKTDTQAWSANSFQGGESKGFFHDLHSPSAVGVVVKMSGQGTLLPCCNFPDELKYYAFIIHQGAAAPKWLASLRK